MTCTAFFSQLAINVNAHPGHDQLALSARTWHVMESEVPLVATCIAVRDNSVQLRTSFGKLVTLPLDKLSDQDRQWVEARQVQIRKINNSNQPITLVSFAPEVKGNVQPTAIAKAFDPFEKLNAIRYRMDESYFYVESNGMPDHPMMVGIRAWQQQVPLFQKYVGDNAWQIPVLPKPAAQPATTKNRFLRGAIALAVNGIPIFNPLNNRGDDSFLFGELDQFGGHCGRADDYHYHLAPVHLEKQVGKGNVIAYALDGYPIYGYEEPDGSKVVGLDRLNGHKDTDGNYHYHATKDYPYLNGGFYGEVTERDGQVDPQPRAEPLRPAMPPLRGATITDFVQAKPGSFRLTYDVDGKKGSVSYTVTNDGTVQFSSVDTYGKTIDETYSPKRGNGRRPPLRRQGENPPPREKESRQGASLPRDLSTAMPSNDRSNGTRNRGETSKPSGKLPMLAVTSRSVNANGFVSIDCTCDGKAHSPAVSWSNAPAATQSFAISLWHTAPDKEKSYWLLYNIPSNVTTVPEGSREIGTIGLNDRRRAEYDPMCSKGPGAKSYHITVYALSAELKFASGKADRAALLDAIKNVTIAEGTLDFQYERNK